MFNYPESTNTNSVVRKMTLNLFIGSSIKAYKFQNNQFSLVSDLVDILKIKFTLIYLSRLFFCHKVGQIKVIENLSYLKGAVDDFSKVSVCIDRNEDERKVKKELVQRAKQQTDESTDKKYVVRGAYHPYIREMNKL